MGDIVTKSLKDYVKDKNLSYSDDFYTLKGEFKNPLDSFSFNSYEILKDIKDIKTNNHSNLFLSKMDNNNKWLESNKDNTATKDMITTISFFTNKPNDGGSWLYFDKNFDFWDINLKRAPCKLTKNRPSESYFNHIFHLKFIDDVHCQIIHNFGDMDFYLSINDNLTIEFVSINDSTDDANTILLYSKTGNFLNILKMAKTPKGDGEEFKETIYILSCSDFDENGNSELILSEDIENIHTSEKYTTIYTVANPLNYDLYVDSSWVSYDRLSSIDKINDSKSKFNLKNQILLHHEFYNDKNINFLPLKNHQTHKGSTIRGDNLTISSINSPDVNFREYTSIVSGSNQELGSENITLNYVFYDQDVTVHGGNDAIFTLDKNENDTMYPYRKLNLNDTKFIKNGAFGSSAPILSDKFFNLNSSDDKNGTFLCSWLYRANGESEPIWLDRYYIPDLLSRELALKNEINYKESFNNIIDQYYEGEMGNTFKNDTCFDKISDLLIEPGNIYKYSRISKNDINDVLGTMSNDSITNIKTKGGSELKIDNELPMDGKTFFKINHKDFNKTNSINLNFDIYLNNKKIGLQLFGSGYKNGFNIQNRKDLTPYHYYSTDKIIYVLNNKFEIIRSFNLNSKYGDYIFKFILGDIFDDIIIIAPMGFYILSYDLKLKSRILYTDILNIDDINLNGINFINYPYSKDNYIDINFPKPLKSNTISIEIVRGHDDIQLNDIAEINRVFSKNLKTTTDNYVPLKTRLSELLSERNIVSYKNNLYMPFKNSIFKFILIPDSPNDNFTDDERNDYPIKIRKLQQSEFIVNYTNSVSDESSTEEGFIEYDREIKHVFINKNGNIYGMNYENYSMTSDGDTICGVRAKGVKEGGFYWLYNTSLAMLESSVASSSFAQFASPESIDHVRYSFNGDMALIRGFSSDKDRRIEIYDKTKKLSYTHYFDDIESILSLDFINYIDEALQENSSFVMLGKSYSGNIVKIEYNTIRKIIKTYPTNLPSNTNKFFIETMSNNSMMRYINENLIHFNLFLPSKYLYDNVITIPLNIANIQEGWYNINVAIDLDKAIFEIRINDELYQKASQKEYSFFKPYQFSNSTIFATTYYIGTTGKKYGITLNSILNKNGNDCYCCKNTKFKNLSIYNKSLKYFEFQSMRLKNKSIVPLNLTIPCGQRNNLDEIERFFRYYNPSSVSNKIKININGTGLNSKGEIELLKKDLTGYLNDKIEATLSIKDIEIY